MYKVESGSHGDVSVSVTLTKGKYGEVMKKVVYNPDNIKMNEIEHTIKRAKLLIENELCYIYENMDEEFVIKNSKKKHIMILVLTLNQFGALSINDHGLIKREDGAPYPWICNWHDFDLIIDLLKYKGKEIEFLLDYIDFRIEKREFLLASDEIDIVDIYFSDKSKLNIDKSLIQIESSMNSLVDQMYFEKKGIPYQHYDNIEVLYPTKKDIVNKIKKHFN